MTQFDVHTPETASDARQKPIQTAVKKFGFLPNLIGVMVESPALAEGYLELAGAFGRSSLSPAEQQIVLITVSYLNDCDYCVAAHTTIAQGLKISADTIEAVRTGGTLPDAKQNALATFTRQLVEARGWADDQAVQAFLDAGYDRQNLLDVVLGVGVKTLSNYTNHVARTPLDDAFTANAWSKEAKAAA